MGETTFPYFIKVPKTTSNKNNYLLQKPEYTDLRSPGGSTGGEGALISMNGSIIGIGKS